MAKLKTTVMVIEVGRNIDANNEQKELYSVVDLSDCRVKKVAWNRKLFIIQWHTHVCQYDKQKQIYNTIE